MPAASSDTENTDAMNRMLDLGEMPDEPIVKANESMNGQFRPDNM